MYGEVNEVHGREVGYLVGVGCSVYQKMIGVNQKMIGVYHEMIVLYQKMMGERGFDGK